MQEGAGWEMGAGTRTKGRTKEGAGVSARRGRVGDGEKSGGRDKDKSWHREKGKDKQMKETMQDKNKNEDIGVS